MFKRNAFLWIISLLLLAACGTPREQSVIKMSAAGEKIGQAQELQRKIDLGEGGPELQKQIDELKIEAIKLSMDAIETDTSNIDAYYNYGIILQSIGQFNKAIEQYQIGLSKLPKPPFAPEMKDSLQNLYNNFNVGLVVCNKNMKNYTAAIGYASNIKQYFPSRYAEALFNYGFYLQATMNESQDPVAQVDSAISVFNNSMRWYREAAGRGSADPQQVYQAAYYTEQAYRSKAKASKSKPDYNGIINAYKDASDANPNNAEVYVRLAAAYDESGQSRQALKVYQTALDKNPGNKTVRNNYAMLLAEKGKTSQAQKEMQYLIDKFPDYAMGYFNMASVLQKKGMSLRSSTVQKYLRKYVELAKSDPSQAQNVQQIEQLLR
jgi:tetratricopeptide (TPR) repeat protein